MFQGRCLRLEALPDGFVELGFERRDDAIDRLDPRTTDELRSAVAILADATGVRGVLVTNAKAGSIVGDDGDATEAHRHGPGDQLARSLWSCAEVFMDFEDLQVPSVVAIDGDAADAGCEFALTTTWRVMADDARIGFPGMKRGLFPGLGGTVRLPRIASPAVAIEWLTDGNLRDAAEASKAGVVDATCPRSELRARCLAWLSHAARGEIDWRSRQVAKRVPVSMPLAAHRRLFEQAMQASGPTTPSAARIAVELMARTTLLPRDAAQWQECEAFARQARTRSGRAMVQAFHDEPALPPT